MLYSITLLQTIFSDILFGYKPQNERLKAKFANGGFSGFYERSKHDPEYKEAFTGCKAFEINNVTTVMTATGNTVPLDVVSIEPEEHPDTHQQLHIITFQGLFGHYESYDCFITYSKIAKAHGAKVYAFNYPGMHRSEPADKSDTVREFNDLTNSGIAVVNHLLNTGVHPDKIVLFGNCIGAGVASAVQNEYWKKDIKLRLIASNTYASFKGVAHSFATQESIHPNLLFLLKILFNFILLESFRKYLLKKAGWDSSITRTLKATDPYHMVIQREQDLAFKKGKLLDKIQKYTDERQQRLLELELELELDSKSDIKDRPDTCPEEYKSHRDRLQAKALLKPMEDELSKVAIFNNAKNEIAKLLNRDNAIPLNKTDKSEQKKFIIILISVFIDTPDIWQDFMKSKGIHTDTIDAIRLIMTQANTQENKTKIDSHPLGMYQLEGFHELLAEYLEASEEYIKANPQPEIALYNLPEFLKTAVQQPSLLHIIIEGLIYALILIGILALIANPVVFPWLMNTCGISTTAISLNLIYSVAVPVLIILSLVFAADFGSENSSLKEEELTQAQVINEHELDTYQNNSPVRTVSGIMTPLFDAKTNTDISQSTTFCSSPNRIQTGY